MWSAAGGSRPAYLAAPRFDAAALPAFQAFRDETVRQFEFLTRPTGRGGLGVVVEVCRDDPYPDAGVMMADLREHRRLKVYATAGSHPFLTNDENDRFRAVHDAFGHAASGSGLARTARKPPGQLVEGILHAVDEYQVKRSNADVKYKMGAKPARAAPSPRRRWDTSTCASSLRGGKSAPSPPTRSGHRT